MLLVAGCVAYVCRPFGLVSLFALASGGTQGRRHGGVLAAFLSCFLYMPLPAVVVKEPVFPSLG